MPICEMDKRNMSSLAEAKATRDQLQQLAQQGSLDPPALARALVLSGHRPDRRAWGQFVDYLLLSLGALFLVSGIVFFFAYNWEDLPRFGRFGLLEAAILLGAAATHYWGLQALPGKVALTVTALLVGVLLAVFGQEYQTGADSYLLFLNWGLLIAAWVLISNFDVLWAILLVLANLTLFLYWNQVLPDSYYPQAETLFVLNGAALIAWEGLHRRGWDWLQARWLPRLLAMVTFGWILFPTVEVIFALFERDYQLATIHYWAPAIYLLWLLFVLFFYTRWVRDLFMLTVAMLSIIIVTTTLLGRALTEVDVTITFLGAGLAVIGQAALAVTWLRRIANRWEAAQ
jgi:uncharacterized membrane protein